METKYTTDGKKVIIVGKLNTQETIVQEIFVSANGQEIASGENFVVKSLHDEPVKSWKQKNLEELEQRYNSEKAKLQHKIESQRRELEAASKAAKFKAQSLKDFANNAQSFHFDTLLAFLGGEITHFYIDKTIKPWNEVMYYDGHNGIEGIRLVSLFGKCDGNLFYKLHSYCDGSGYSREIVPFKSYQDALVYAQKQLDDACSDYFAGKRTLGYAESFSKIDGLIVDKRITDAIEQENLQQKQNKIKALEAELQKLQNS